MRDGIDEIIRRVALIARPRNIRKTVENTPIGSFKLHIGNAVIEIIDHVGRCAAINVDPATATRESDYLAIMRHSFGHSHLGVFGRVIKKGVICTGDSVSVIQQD